MLVGRAAERAHLDRLLQDAVGGRSGALVLRGDAGVGKTELLGYAALVADGWRVLRAIGIESEASFALSGVMQLAVTLLRTRLVLRPGRSH